MRRVATNLQPVKLGDFTAVPSIPNFVPKIRTDRAAVLSGRAAIIAALPNIARTRQAGDVRDFASRSSEPFLLSKAFTDISWDEEEDDGIDDICAPKARDIGVRSLGHCAFLSCAI
jgi:hypothetical protein